MRFTIATLPGDGIGPEIMEQAVAVLHAVAEKFGHKFDFRYGDVGAVAIDKTGDPFPEATFELCKEADAVLFGAIGDPRYDNDPKAKIRPEQGLLAMRKKLDLFANIRPVTTFTPLLDKSPLKKEIIEKVDFVIIRELTGGLYFGEPRGRSEDGDKAFETNIYTREEINRILEVAFAYARERSGKLTVVDKANVLSTSRLWRETAQEKASECPDVEVDYLFVDNAAMQIIQNPQRFDVVVTENMFGDILTDEASVITGSMGLLPSASVGILTSLFEPVHGAYPQATGKNIANPLAMILSAAMMLETGLGLKDEAALVRQAVNESLETGFVTEDIEPLNARHTSEVGQWITAFIRKK